MLHCLHHHQNDFLSSPTALMPWPSLILFIPTKPSIMVLYWELRLASVILRTGIDLRVHHIKGKQNIRPDLLSWLLLEEFTSKFPSYCIHLFDPPRDLRWRECFWAHWVGVVVHIPPAHEWSYLTLIIELTIFRPAPLKNRQQKDTLLVHAITFRFVSSTHTLSAPHLKHYHISSPTPPNSLVLDQNIYRVHVISYPTFIPPSMPTIPTLSY